MIGNYADACAATDGELPYLDEGCYRKAYLKDNVVYKVVYDMDSVNPNESEYKNYLRLSTMSLPEPIRIPETSLYSVYGEPVIAMQFIPGVPMWECWHGMDEECNKHCLPEHIRMLIAPYMPDSAGKNLIIHDGKYWLIDLEG